MPPERSSGSCSTAIYIPSPGATGLTPPIIAPLPCIPRLFARPWTRCTAPGSFSRNSARNSAARCKSHDFGGLAAGYPLEDALQQRPVARGPEPLDEIEQARVAANEDSAFVALDAANDTLRRR